MLAGNVSDMNTSAERVITTYNGGLTQTRNKSTCKMVSLRKVLKWYLKMNIHKQNEEQEA